MSLVNRSCPWLIDCAPRWCIAYRCWPDCSVIVISQPAYWTVPPFHFYFWNKKSPNGILRTAKRYVGLPNKNVTLLFIILNFSGCYKLVFASWCTKDTPILSGYKQMGKGGYCEWCSPHHGITSGTAPASNSNPYPMNRRSFGTCHETYDRINSTISQTDRDEKFKRYPCNMYVAVRKLWMIGCIAHLFFFCFILWNDFSQWPNCCAVSHATISLSDQVHKLHSLFYSNERCPNENLNSIRCDELRSEIGQRMRSKFFKKRLLS